MDHHSSWPWLCPDHRRARHSHAFETNRSSPASVMTFPLQRAARCDDEPSPSHCLARGSRKGIVAGPASTQEVVSRCAAKTYVRFASKSRQAAVGYDLMVGIESCSSTQGNHHGTSPLKSPVSGGQSRQDTRIFKFRAS